MGKVTLRLVGLAPVEGLLDHHGGRSESFECDDQMGHVELGFKVQLDAHFLHAVAGLKPSHSLHFSG